MRLQRQILGVDAIELGQEVAGVSDGVDADLPAAAVRRASVRGDVGPDESEMRRHDREARGLGDDRRVGSNAGRDQRSRPDALVLFVDDRRDHHFSLELVGRARRRGAHRRDAGFHVRRPASVDASLTLKCIPRRVRHAVHADDVEMSVEHQRASA